MRLSIFTPTHDPRFLSDVWDSIKGQPFDEWLVLHNGASRKKLGIGDERMREIVAPACPPFAGAAKRLACEEASGEILVEVDHDDQVLPGAIEKVRKAFAENSDAGMVYSNFVRARMVEGGLAPDDQQSWQGSGWQFRNFPGGLVETRAFAPDPASVSRIWFAPDHVRAFRRDIYEQVGGHRSDMRVLDDLDLMGRMFASAPFVHIDDPLYLYRIHDRNTWIEHNAEIQQNVMRIYDQHIDKIVLAWAKRQGLLALDLGGAIAPEPGYQTVDLRGADVTADLDQRWPWSDSSVGVLRAQDVLEHLRDPLHVMREAYRVLAPGGWLFASVPSTDGRGAFQDPTHRSFWNENSWLYYTHKDFAGYIGSPVKFQAVVSRTTPKDDRGVCWTVAHLISCKDGYRPPGILNW